MKTKLKKAILASMMLFAAGFLNEISAHRTVSGTFKKLYQEGNVITFTCLNSTDWCCRLDDFDKVYEVNANLIVIPDPSHTYDDATATGSFIVQ